MAAKLTPEEKIAKLLEKAETTTPGEAEALTEQASRLMIKYAIDQAKIDAARLGTTEKREEIVIKNIELKGIYRAGYQNIMFSVVRAMGITRAFIEQPWNQKNTTIFRVVGYQSDVEQLVVLLTSLQLQAVSALSTWWKDTSDDYGTAMQKFKARRQFLISFGNGAAHRIEVARSAVFKQEKKSHGSSFELVLVDRDAAINQFLEAFDLKSIRSHMSGGGNEAASAGFDAGKNANTGDKPVGGTKKALNA